MDKLDIEKFKKKQLEILHELDRVCKKHQINYYLAYGSCLGAVRHKGFIPWDDDIDVVLTAHDMERLLSVKDSFEDKYFLQCRETQKNWTNMCCSLNDSTTSCFLVSKGTKDINHGVGIDIYVLYPYPDNPLTAHKLILESYVLRILYLRECNELPQNHGIFAKIGSWFLMNLFSDRSASKMIKNIESRLKNNGGKNYYSVFFGNDITLFSSLKFPVEMFKEPKYLKFEDFMAPCPSNPELMCKICYGDSYMEFPPEEQRVSPHTMIYLNCDEPYTKFEGQYYFKDKTIKD